MSALHHDTSHHEHHAGAPRRRADLDHDRVAILAMMAILALTVACFLAQGLLAR
ncbi:hypothetical protein [Nocardioides dongxiaopingii]|uniref:hypothetical protein n=1 Tax=Nocardioides TaxID=1839 RepID=UPI001484EC73|nr:MULTISPECIES: hypothetical protein [Nocardioides]